MSKQNQSNLYDCDTFESALASFKAMQSRDESVNPLKLVRAGNGFAIGSNFKVLSMVTPLRNALSRFKTSKAILNHISSLSYDKQTDCLYYPSESIAMVLNISPSIASGGLVHEKGHEIYDLACSTLSPSLEYNKKHFSRISDLDLVTVV